MLLNDRSCWPRDDFYAKCEYTRASRVSRIIIINNNNMKNGNVSREKLWKCLTGMNRRREFEVILYYCTYIYICIPNTSLLGAECERRNEKNK